MQLMAINQLGSEPVGIAHVIIRNALDLTLDHFLRYFFELLRWYTCINTASFTNHILRNQRPGGNNGIAVDHRLVHYNCSHPDQYIIVDGAPVNNSIMSY